jgi:hypothetical protein
MICRKCSIDKPVDQYDTYFHSTQNKIRTRKYCKSCYRKQKQQYKNRIKLEKEDRDKFYQNNPNYCKCNTCQTWKEISYYYLRDGKVITKKCKDCQKVSDRIEAEKLRELNGGSKMVPQKPNVYFDEYQRANTFELMQLLGYLYDEASGIWIKPGWKEVIDGKPVFTQLRKRKYTLRRGIVTDEMIFKVLDYRKRNWTRAKIANKIGVSENTVMKICTEYGNETRQSRGT